MSIIQSTRRPFPVELFAHLEVDDDYILDGNKVIGVMGDPIPTAIDDETYKDSDEIERLLKKGYEVEGYEGYSINSKGIPTRSVDLHNYPKDKATIDVFDCIYFEGFCIGKFVYGGLLPVEKDDLSRLSELGIEYRYLYGTQSRVSTWSLGAYHDDMKLLISYAMWPSKEVVIPDVKLVMKSINGIVQIIGQISFGNLIPLTDDQVEHYTNIGFEVSNIKQSQFDPVILPWFAKKGLYCDMTSNMILKLGSDNKYTAIGSRRDDAFVPLSEADRKTALQLGFLLE